MAHLSGECNVRKGRKNSHEATPTAVCHAGSEGRSPLPTTSGTVNQRHGEVFYHPETYQALGGWNGNRDGVYERTQAYMWCVEGARVNNRTHVQMQTHISIDLHVNGWDGDDAGRVVFVHERERYRRANDDAM